MFFALCVELFFRTSSFRSNYDWNGSNTINNFILLSFVLHEFIIFGSRGLEENARRRKGRTSKQPESYKKYIINFFTKQIGKDQRQNLLYAFSIFLFLVAPFRAPIILITSKKKQKITRIANC